MGELMKFETIAGFASIVAILITLSGLVIKSIQGIKKRKNDADREFNIQIEKYEAAGRTVPARTDLGTLVTIELGSLHNKSAENRVLIILFAIFLSISLNIFPISVLIDKSIEFNIIFLFTTTICAGAILVLIIVHIRFESFIKKYESCVKEIWNQPVEKRFKSLEETQQVTSPDGDSALDSDQ